MSGSITPQQIFCRGEMGSDQHQHHRNGDHAQDGAQQHHIGGGVLTFAEELGKGEHHIAHGGAGEDVRMPRISMQSGVHIFESSEITSATWPVRRIFAKNITSEIPMAMTEGLRKIFLRLMYFLSRVMMKETIVHISTL